MEDVRLEVLKIAKEKGDPLYDKMVEYAKLKSDAKKQLREAMRTGKGIDAAVDNYWKVCSLRRF